MQLQHLSPPAARAMPPPVPPLEHKSRQPAVEACLYFICIRMCACYCYDSHSFSTVGVQGAVFGATMASPPPASPALSPSPTPEEALFAAEVVTSEEVRPFGSYWQKQRTTYQPAHLDWASDAAGLVASLEHASLLRPHRLLCRSLPASLSPSSLVSSSWRFGPSSGSRCGEYTRNGCVAANHNAPWPRRTASPAAQKQRRREASMDWTARGVCQPRLLGG